MREQVLINAIGRCSPAWVAHWANMGVRNIFNRYYKAPAIFVIKDEIQQDNPTG